MNFLYYILGNDLASYLAGTASPAQTSNMCNMLGGLLLFLAFVFVALYYKFLDRQSWNNMLSWILFLLVPAVINFIVVFVLLYADFRDGKMIDGNGDILHLSWTNFLGAGLLQFIYSALVFLVFSVIVNFFCKKRIMQSDCSTTPFKF